MRSVILAGVSALVLTFGGVGIAHAAASNLNKASGRAAHRDALAGESDPTGGIRLSANDNTAQIVRPPVPDVATDRSHSAENGLPEDEGR